MIGLLDCNNFFVSCERLFRPELANEPIGVMSNNDGCIIARSNELKALGVPMGAPVFKYKDLLNKYAVKLFSANFELYSIISNRIMHLLSTFSSQVEVYSIDECFFDVKSDNLYELGKEIRRTVFRTTGIYVGIGFAETKTLAKLANSIAKKTKSGVCDLGSYNHHLLFKTIKIGDVWGIGKRIENRLYKKGVITVNEFLKMPPTLVKKEFTVTGYRTYLELKGVSCITLQKIQFYSSNDIDSSEILSSNYSVASDFLKWTSGQDQKQIISSRSFPEKYISYNDIYAALCSNLSKALLKLRRLGKIVRRYSFYVKAGPFNQAVYFSDVVDIGCYSNDDILFF